MHSFQAQRIFGALKTRARRGIGYRRLLSLLLLPVLVGSSFAILGPASAEGQIGPAVSPKDVLPAAAFQQAGGSGLDLRLAACPNESAESDEQGSAQTQGPVVKAGGSLSASVAPPTVRLAPASDTGVSNQDRLTGNNMPSFEGSAVAGRQIAVFDGSKLIGLTTADAHGYWTSAPDPCSALADGEHAITARAVDQAGNYSAPSAVLTLTIDTDPPAMPVITAPARDGRASGGRVTVAGTAAPGMTIKVMDGRSVISTRRSDGNGTWSLTLNGVAAGKHAYRASAVDDAGNESPAFNTTTLQMAASNAPQATVSPAQPGSNAAPLSAGAAAQSTGATTSPSIVAMTGGDIACGTGSTGNCQQMATANLLVSANPDIVLPLGDNEYECGSLADFNNYYGPSWGKLFSRTHPAVGNHEYQTSSTSTDPCYNAPAGAPGYFTYFGNRATPNQPGCTAGCTGYYSYDVGAWHIIVLNSVCGQAGGCGLGSPQETWLKNDLAAHPTACTLAYWHYPRFTSGLSGTVFLSSMKAFWQDLYNGGVEIVLNGHDHDYERIARLDVNGNPDPTNGVREFVVGTGGKSHQPFVTIAANSEVRNSDTFGALKLTLKATSYSWQFVPVAGNTFTDAGTEACH